MRNCGAFGDECMKSSVRLLVLDIDGVLTDGSDSIPPGEKRLFLRDLDALTRARRDGLGIAFLTGEPREVAEPIVKRCGGGVALYGMKDKAQGMRTLVEQHGLSMEEVCYVADGERDAPALEYVGLALTPCDASNAARSVADRVLSSRGGRGAVEEAVLLLTSAGQMKAEALTVTVREELRGAVRDLQALADGELEQLVQVIEMMANALSAKGKVVLFGNGGSAAIAQHIATELVGRYANERGPLPAIALTADTALLTALANDFGYEEIFQRQVEALVHHGDVAIGMSTSGRSLNVARALAAANDRGARTIAMVGNEAGEVGAEADHCLTFEAAKTARIQELHLTALHVACACIDALPGLARPRPSEGTA